MPVILFHGTTDVFPKDIEEIIVQHPAVREAPVFGIPNEKWGELPAGYRSGLRRSKQTLTSAPPEPHIGFLLTHYDTAVNLMDSVSKTKIAVTPQDISFKNAVEHMMSDLLKKQADCTAGFHRTEG